MTSNGGPPAHLSEFYSLISPNNPDKTAPVMAPTVTARHRTEPETYVANGHHRNNSLMGSMGSMLRRASFSSINTVGQSTIGSNAYDRVAENHPDLPALITNKEINTTLAAYRQLLASAEGYKNALDGVSKASAEFGAALEACSQVKGAGNSADGLAAAGGLHFLVSNHQQVLVKSIESAFEEPVRENVSEFKKEYEKREEEFRAKLKERTAALRKKEALNSKMARARTRNLQTYRNSLLELTTQIDDIDRLKYEYFQNAYELAQQTSSDILQHAASVVRAQVEIFEGIARKGWSGGGLDELIATCPDPFENTKAPVSAMTLHNSSDSSIGRGLSRVFSEEDRYSVDSGSGSGSGRGNDDDDDNDNDNDNDKENGHGPSPVNDALDEDTDEHEDANDTHDTLSLGNDFPDTSVRSTSTVNRSDHAEDSYHPWGTSGE